MPPSKFLPPVNVIFFGYHNPNSNQIMILREGSKASLDFGFRERLSGAVKG